LLRPVRPVGRPGLAAALHGPDRGRLLHLPPDLAQPASVRQHAGRPHRTEGLRRLRRRPHGWLERLPLRPRTAAALPGGCPDRDGVPRRRPAGLRLRDPDLRLSQRCPASGPLSPAGPRETKTPTLSFSHWRKNMDPVAAKYIG